MKSRFDSVNRQGLLTQGLRTQGFTSAKNIEMLKKKKEFFCKYPLDNNIKSENAGKGPRPKGPRPKGPRPKGYEPKGYKPKGCEPKVIETDYGPTLFYNGIHLHSRVNPLKEAEAEVEKVNLEGKDIILIYGTGFWYHIKEILKGLKTDSSVFIIEKEFDIFKIALKQIDLSKLINNQNIYLFVDCKIDSVVDKFKEIIDKFNTPRIEEFLHQPSIKLNENYYNMLREKLRNIVNQKWSSYFTKRHFSNTWTKNFLLNMRFLKKPVKLLFNKYRNIPCLIIAAGPTATDQLALIKKFRKKFILIAVDSVLRLCLKSGITPDYCLSLDSQYLNFQDFKFTNNSDVSLVMDMFSNHCIAENFKGDIFFSITGHLENDKFKTEPIADWFIKKFDNLGFLQSGGSVSTTAFDFALNIGCNPIITAGLDLCFINYNTHSKMGNSEILSIKHSNRLYTYDTINSRYVAMKSKRINDDKEFIFHIDFIMDNYRRWFEEAGTLVKRRLIYTGSPMPLKNWEYFRSLSDIEFKFEVSKLEVDFSFGKERIRDLIREIKEDMKSGNLPDFLLNYKVVHSIINSVYKSLL